MILSVVSYERKKFEFYTKNNIFINVFCNRIVPFTIASYQFSKNDWIFIYRGLFFWIKYFSQKIRNDL